MASTTTQDHDFIQQWAEKRGGKPAEVASTEQNGQTGILRLEFPGAPNANDAALKEIGWEEFFEKFDASGLEFLYQEETAEGELSNFNKLVYPDPESTAGKSLLKKTARKRSSAKTAARTSSPAKTSAKATSKSAAKKTPAKKTAAKKVVAKKGLAKKVAAKGSSTKKAPTKTTSAKKTSIKKTSAKKTATKKVTAKKPAVKKMASKKTTRR